MTITRTALLFGLLLAQAGFNDAPATPGIPHTYGTRTPEQSPATTVAPSYNAPTGTASPPAATVSPPAGTSSGPGYSFGAAPPPVVAPGR